MITFGDMMADMLSNKKLNPIVIEVFIRSKNSNISLVFVIHPYFAARKKQTKF